MVCVDVGCDTVGIVYTDGEGRVLSVSCSRAGVGAGNVVCGVGGRGLSV